MLSLSISRSLNRSISQFLMHVLGGIALIGATTLAAGPDAPRSPGTAGDPLVSKSYLEQMFRFRAMVIPAGGSLRLAKGNLLVLRSGRVKLRAPRGKSLADLTAGASLADGALLPANHLILVPDSSAYTLEAQTLALLLGQGFGAAAP